MSIEDIIGCQSEAPSCVVCGKNVAHGGGFSHVNRLGWPGHGAAPWHGRRASHVSHAMNEPNCDEQDAHDMARLADLASDADLKRDGIQIPPESVKAAAVGNRGADPICGPASKQSLFTRNETMVPKLRK